MRVKIALYLVGIGLACQGCAPLWQSARTSIVQPLIYRRSLTDIRECHRNRELAEEAWGDFVNKHHETMEYSPDFECGFKEGYCDYLFYGGTGAPPPVPPRCYWNFKYETEQGHKAIQNWFAGFRAGADSARASGYRKLVVVPASTCLPSLTSPATQPVAPAPAAAPNTLPQPRSGAEEMLPPPRPTAGPDNPANESPPTNESLPPAVAPSPPPEQAVPISKQAADTEHPALQQNPRGDVGIPSTPAMAISRTVATDCRWPSQSGAKAP